MQFTQSQQGSFSAQVANASQQGCGSVASSWESSSIEHGELLATGDTQTCWDVDDCSRSSAPDNQQQPLTDASAAGAACGEPPAHGFPSPVQHFKAALQPSPAMTACFSPIAAPPAALPPAPEKVCRAAPPQAPDVAHGLAKQIQFSNARVARVLELAPDTGDLPQQVQVSDWLTSKGV